MGTYSEYKKKYKTSSKNNTAPTVQEDAAEPTSAYARYKAKYAKSRSERLTSTVNSTIQQYLSDYQTFADTAASDRDSVGYSTAKSALDSRLQTASDLRKRAGELSLYLDANRDLLTDDAYEQLSSSVSTSRQNVDAIMDDFESMTRYYAQWDTEDAYNQSVKESEWQKEYGGKSYSELKELLNIVPKGTDGDLWNWLNEYAPTVMTAEDYTAEITAAEDEIKLLEAVQKEYDQLALQESTQNPGSYANTRLAEIRKQYGSSADIGTKLEELKATKWNYENGRKYGTLSQNEDYASKSGYVSTELTGFLDKLTSKYGMGYGDLTYEYINGQEDLREEILRKTTAYNADGDALGKTTAMKLYDYMTDEEKANYNYLYSTEGKDSANDYLSYLECTLNARSTQTAKQNAAAFADEHPVLSSVARVPLNLLSGAGTLDIAWQNLQKSVTEAATGEYAGPIDYNSGAMSASVISSTILGTVAQNIADSTGTISLDEEAHPILSKLFNGKSLGDVYQLGMSMVDSAAVAALSPVLGAGGTALLGGSAATQGILDAVSKGATDGQALMMGVLNGAFEMLFEKYELENLLGADTNVLKAIANQALTEGIGEGATTVANTLADILVMAENSDWQANVDAYIAKDLNEEEAKKQAFLDTVTQIGWDFVGGAAMGGIMGGGASAVGNITNAIGDAASTQMQYRETGSQIIDSGDVDALKALADEMAGVSTGGVQKQLVKQSGKVSGDNVKARNVGKLYSAVQSAVTEQNVSQITQRLEQDGISAQQAREIAGAVTAALSGSELTQAQSEILTSVENDSRVRSAVTEIFGDGKATVEQRIAKMKDAKDTEATPAATETMPETENAVAEGNSTAEETSASEGGYTASEDGKTYLKSKPTQAVSIKEISSIKDGKMTLELEDGRQVDAGDVEYASADEALVYETVAQMDVPAMGANILVNAYHTDTGVSAEVYARGIQEAFIYGKYNFAQQEMEKGPFSSMLTEHQRRTAYKLGQMFSGKAVAKAQAAVQKSRNATADKSVGKVHFDGDRSSLNGIQKSSLDALDMMAKVLGIQIYVFESEVDENGKRIGANGWYDPSDGSIYIDLYAGADGKGTMLFTVAHELTHFIRQWSPAKFKALANFLMREYGKKGVSVDAMVREQMAKAKRNGRKISYDTAYEEVVADSMETMLADGSIIEMMAELKQQDKTLWQKIRGWFKDLVGKLRAVVDTYKGVKPDSVEGRLVADMQDVIGTLQALYMDALVDASENFDGGGQKNTAAQSGGEVRYMARGEADTIKEQLLAVTKQLNRMEIVSSVQTNGYSGMRKDEIAKIIESEYAKFGKRVDRQNFGIILLEFNQINKALNYLNTDGEKAALLTVPRVLKRGIIAESHNKHKERQVDSITFAAPVEINGVRGNVAVVVQRATGTNRFKTLRILLPNGKAFEFAKNNEADSTTGGSPKHLGLEGTPIESAPKNSIRNPEPEVKKKLSDRDPDYQKVNKVLERENQKLKEDVAYLKELVKLQRQVTGGTKFTKSSVEAAARYLKQNANAKGDTKELAGLLNNLYEYIASAKELTWEDVREQAQPAVEWLQDHAVTQSQPAEQEYAYNGELVAQELLQQVYDSYWRASTLHTVADVKQQEITRLKGEHNQRMEKLRANYKEKVEQLKKEHRADLERVRQEDRQRADNKQQEIIERYQESRKKGIEGRRKTEMRRQIRKNIRELNKLLTRGTKERNVKEGMKDLVANAIASAEVLFTDTYSTDDMIRSGVGVELTEKESKLLNECVDILAQLDNAPAVVDAEGYSEWSEAEKKLKDKLDYREKQLEEVFQRERRRLDRTTVAAILGNLCDAYSGLKESNESAVSGAYDEDVYQHLLQIRDGFGVTRVMDMRLDQLEALRDAYTMVLTTVRNANKAFKAKKNESIETIAKQVMTEVQRTGGTKAYGLKGLDGIKSFGWNNLKPVYAFEHIGSAALTEVFNNVRAGEDVWARDVTAAREFYLDKSRKYKYDSWDFKTRFTFTSASGMDFSLGLEQIMSLYAYSKREQAAEHLRKGGIVIDETTEVTVKNKFGIPLKFNPTEATAYNITEETLAEIISKLTPEQKAFADEMQDYLSSTMGAKGNEVSMQMYGIELFKEKHYFPLRSATQFMEKAKDQQKGEVKIKNAGFSKETVKKASNPIVLTPFMNVWADHVNEMSMYHAFVLPMEDFYRVYNYKTAVSDTAAVRSVEMCIQNAYGKGATKYIDQLLKDLNGGARTDSTTGFINKMMGLYKKGAVFASMSVVIQQPSAVARAAAIVDLKYFIGPKVDHKRHKDLWNEVKQYAPVAVIKEMGYFDTNMGKSTQDFILSKEYSGFTDKMKALVKDSGYRDEILSKAPALADEIAWCGIWEAVKRETRAKNPKMDVTSDAFLELAGDRFTEVIVKTQVYDSVLSRSALMRSKDTGMKMATAFMAEPTTSINMIADALLKGKRGDRKYARTAIGAVIASQILNSILVSFVYAGRDDDEDKSYWEKYIGALTGEALDSLNPAGYIPFVRDIISIVQGYDVERSDMAVISDLWNAWKNLGSDNISAYRKLEGFAGSIAQIFGLPVKNIMRDARGIYQTVMSFVAGEHTTGAGIKYAVKEAVTGQATSDRQQLYEAYLNGDKSQIARGESRFEDQTAINSAIRKALRENDSRIHDAAVARINEDLDEYMRLAKQVIAEGHFSQDDVVAAVNGEINAMSDSSTAASSKAKGLFDADDFATAVFQRDADMANAAKEEILRAAQKNGKTAEEAEKSFASAAVAACKERYLTGDLSSELAVDALVTYCGKSKNEALADVEYWAYTQAHPDADVSAQWFDTYYEKVADSGLSIEAYVEYRNRKSGYTKKTDILKIIDGLDLKDKQKDTLYLAEGWAESTLNEAPWH